MTVTTTLTSIIANWRTAMSRVSQTLTPTNEQLQNIHVDPLPTSEVTTVSKKKKTATKLPLTSDVAKALLDYNPVTGEFHWSATVFDILPLNKHRPECQRKPGAPVKWTRHNMGYDQVWLGPQYGAWLGHRLAWLITEGSLPSRESGIQVDHINRVKTDNQRSNLRLASRSQNLSNQTFAEKPGSLPVGVTITPAGRYRAVCGFDGASIYCGIFDTPEEAGAAYLAKAQELRGEFFVPPAKPC